MKHEAMIAWTGLYIGVGIMGLLCAGLAAIVTAHDWHSRRWRPQLLSPGDFVLLVPRLWLRWQRNYLRGAPVIIAIALFYAADTGFGVFWDL